MASTTPSREDDIVILELLDARDNAGLRGVALRDYGERATGVRLNNAQVQGLRGRIRKTYVDPAYACFCARPENRDGGMPERWWAQ